MFSNTSPGRSCLAAMVLAITALVWGQGPASSDADMSQRVLREDFETGGFSAEGGLYYKENAEQKAGKVVFQSRNAATGRSALTLSVVPFCEANSDSCSERAEIWERPEVLAAYDRAVWYGFAMTLDDPLPQDDGRYVMAQWKREIIPGADGDYSPFMALRLYEGRLGITIESDMVETFPIGGPDRRGGCKPGEARVLNRPTARQTRALVAIETGATVANYPDYFDSCAPAIQVTRHADLPSAQKGWIDFVFRSGPGPDGDGHIEVLADGVRIVTVKGRIGHRGEGLDKNQYFKFGPYRAPSALPWSVSYDDFRRGPRCTDVIRAGQCPAD